MKFLELHLKGFGKFHDRTISFTDGINVIYGKYDPGRRSGWGAERHGRAGRSG